MNGNRTRFWVVIWAVASILVWLGAAWAGSEGSAEGLRVLDISERTYEGGPAIAVTLSKPLDPKVRHDVHVRISDEEKALQGGWVLSEDNRVLFFPNVDPETVYSVVVLDTLTAADGSTLSERAIKSVTTRAVAPGVSFASEGLILAKDLAKGLPLVTVNVDDVEIDFFRLNDKGINQYVNWLNASSRRYIEDVRDLKENGELVYSGRYGLNPPKNRRTVVYVPISGVEALSRPGVFFAVLRQPGEYDWRYQSTFLMVTDIGLHARVYPHQTVITASSLKTGLPLSGVELTWLNQKNHNVGSGTTDDQGRFVFDFSVAEKKATLVKAEAGGQLAVIPFDIPALDLSDFPNFSRLQRPREIFVYGPRDLYRPGETVTVAALLRDHDGRPVKDLPLSAELFRPDGRKVSRFTWQPKDLGTAGQGLGYYQTELDLSGDAQTGRYRLELRDNPSAKSAARVYSFQVEDFMPERMKLDLSSDQDQLGTDADWRIRIQGDYLYGAPAAGNKFEAAMTMRPAREIFDSWSGFEFGLADPGSLRDSWDLSGALDDQGAANLEVERRWNDVQTPLSVRAVVSLYETGGRPVIRRIDRVVWPADTLIGIRPRFDPDGSVDEGTVGFELIKVGPDGKLQPAGGLLAALTKEERDYYWEFSDDRGWEQKYTEKNFDVQTEVLTLGDQKPTPLTLDLRSGQYVLSVKDPETGLTSSLRFRVGGWWYDADGGAAAKPDAVEMTLDRKSYLPGDVIRLTVTPPHGGEAMILVESDRLLWFKRLPVSAEGTVVEIPVAAHWDRHDLFISAVSFRPGDAKEKITPNRAVGLIHLPLDREKRRLNVTVQAPERLSPQGPTPLEVKIRLDQRPKGPVMATVAAVDVGILNITNFKTPAPWAWYFDPRRFRVEAFDLYGRVVELMDGRMARLKFGGDADTAPGGKRPETRIKLLSVFSGPVTVDENGEAQVTLTMPGDFNGRVRIMAVAFGQEAFGSGEKEVTVAAPVVTQLAHPRFLAPGDQSRFTLDVHNLSGQKQDLGLTLTATSPVLLAEPHKALTLADQEKQTLTFPIEVQQGFGASKVELSVTGTDLALGADWQIGVRPGYPGLTRQVRQVIQKGQEFILDPALAEGLMPETVATDVKISSTLPVEVKGLVRRLIHYPYGCLEQTTSRAFPLLYASEENLERFGLDHVPLKQRTSWLKSAIERVSLMQQAKGGFSLWSSGGSEEPYLTGYVTDFLLQARDKGLEAPSGVLERAFKRLDGYVNRKWPVKKDQIERDQLDFAVRCYAAYVLGRVGRAPLGALRIMYDQHREEAGSCLPLVHLGLALKAMGDHRRGDDALSLAPTVQRASRGYWGDYGSPIRDLALSVALLADENPDSRSLQPLILSLSDSLRQRQWLSTQEQYALFKAGLALDRQSGKTFQGTLTIAGRQEQVDRRHPLVLSPSLDQVRSGVSFSSNSKGMLYVSALVSGYPQSPPPKDDSVIMLERTWYDLQGDPVEEPTFNVGDLVLVRVTVRATEDLPDALIVDLLPAGFEIENPNFENTVKIADTELDDLKIDGKSVYHRRRRLNVQHEEFRDDRFVAAASLTANRDYDLFYLVRAVTPGRFTVPPPFAESMYRPEIRGVGAAPPPMTVINE